MGSVEQDARWSNVVGLAYWNLYVVRDIVGRSVRPWERYKPTPPESRPATPSQARRGFGRLLPELGTPASAPQPRGKSPERPKATVHSPESVSKWSTKARNRPPTLPKATLVDDAPALARVHVDSWRTAYRELVPESYLQGFSYQWREER
ncbi:MAG: hypothetical protein V3S14_10765 [Anaerolineae bacterium]